MKPWENPEIRSILEEIAQRLPQAYLVGGAVRDPLLGLSTSLDLDLAVTGDGFALARELAGARGRGTTFVPLDKATGTGRLVLWDAAQATLDISSLKGPTIREDLFERDFTINALAIAVSDLLSGASDRVIDSTGGLDDLRSGVITACSANAFRSDPLRILRAFRFRACLGFQIGRGTRDLMSGSVPALADISPERIREELFAVLSTVEAADVLEEMDAMDVLGGLFPETHPMRGCIQNPHHHLDVWAHTLEAIRQLEEIVRDPGPRLGDWAELVQPYLREELVSPRSKGALLKFATLFHDAGKPHARTVDETGRIRFFSHEKISRQIFESVGNRLRLARREIRLGGDWVGGHMRTMIFTRETVSRRAIYRLHRDFQRDFTGLLLIFLADLAATRGPARDPKAEITAFRNVREALDQIHQAREKGLKPFLNGTEVMTRFGVSPGPKLGALLRKLQELQGMGEIGSREEALAAAARILADDEAWSRA